VGDASRALNDSAQPRQPKRDEASYLSLLLPESVEPDDLRT